MMLDFAACGARVFAPSPLEGEGMNALPRVVLGEGASSQKNLFEKTPSPITPLLKFRVALSLKGRGHDNARRALGARA
jgi:hypothetical protein